MRTTVTFDDDTAAAIEKLRRERGVGVSTVVNDLVREALLGSGPRPTFVQRTSAGHARIDVNDVAAALDALEGPGRH
ncbi:MAG: ribbon-helix-helix protein, CopG family [Actinomycetota bacterium]|nr:ribbon-helix-helix protein, CopG family [Actinomycetota bacterium]